MALFCFNWTPWCGRGEGVGLWRRVMCDSHAGLGAGHVTQRYTLQPEQRWPRCLYCTLLPSRTWRHYCLACWFSGVQIYLDIIVDSLSIHCWSARNTTIMILFVATGGTIDKLYPRTVRLPPKWIMNDEPAPAENMFIYIAATVSSSGPRRSATSWPGWGRAWRRRSSEFCSEAGDHSGRENFAENQGGILFNSKLDYHCVNWREIDDQIVMLQSNFCLNIRRKIRSLCLTAIS